MAWRKLALLSFVLYSLCTWVLADTSVRSSSLTTPLCRAGNTSGSLLSMVIEKPASGSGEQESDPFVTYIPLGDGTTQKLCTSVSNGNLLPRAPSGASFIQMTLHLRNDSGVTQTLYAAVKDGSNYEVFTQTSTITVASSVSTVTEVNPVFTLTNVCANQSNSCTTIASATADGSREGELIIYFFLDSAVRNAGDVISTNDDGIFYTLKISDKLPSGTYSLSNLRKGDSQVVATLSGGDSMTQMGSNLSKTIVFRYTVSGDQAAQCPQTPILASQGSILQTENPVTVGDLTVRELTNGTAYNLAFALRNKFQFTSQLTTSLTQTPLDIKALLQETQCFLLTVGFASDHPVLDIFRHWRDRVLLGPFWGNHLGKVSVHLYYRFGPKLAMQVWKLKKMGVDLTPIIRWTAEKTASWLK